MNDDAILGSEDTSGNLPMKIDETADDKIAASNEPEKETTAKVQSLHGEVEAMIAGKVRSLTKPRSG